MLMSGCAVQMCTDSTEEELVDIKRDADVVPVLQDGWEMAVE